MLKIQNAEQNITVNFCDFDSSNDMTILDMTQKRKVNQEK